MVRVGRVFRGVGGSGVVVLGAPSVCESKVGTDSRKRETGLLNHVFDIILKLICRHTVLRCLIGPATVIVW